MKKYLKYLFGLFSFGLTLISMQSGFYFYKILFGLSTAILATGVFEILRLATLLYLSLNLETKKKVVAGILYLMVAFICAFAASSSFHARIIESYQRDLLPYTTVMEGRASVIQQKYAEIYAGKLADIEEKIDICRKKTIIEPNSTYWPNRLAQVLEDRHAVILERDSLISSVPAEDKIGDWVDRHAAITGVSFEALPLSRLGAAAITEAVHELWDIGELSVKKLMALAIVLAIEIGIILLAVFARFYAKEASQEKELLSREVSSRANGVSAKEQGQPAKGLALQKSNGRPAELVRASEPETEKIAREETHLALQTPVYKVTPGEEFQESKETRQEEAAQFPTPEKESNSEEGLQESEELPEVEPDNTSNEIRRKIMNRLQSEFRDHDIETFLKLNVPFFKDNGKLLPAGKLNRRLHPIRRALNKEFSKEELQNFFDFQ